MPWCGARSRASSGSHERSWGSAKLMLAFYDQPELLHQINSDLLEFNIKLFEQMRRVCVPTFATIAEDMSYNHGPMISKKVFDEFVAPYYRRFILSCRNLTSSDRRHRRRRHHGRPLARRGRRQGRAAASSGRQASAGSSYGGDFPGCS